MDSQDYINSGTMPPAIMPDESAEQRKRRLIASAGGMSAMPPVRVTPAQPSSAPSAANTLPPVPVASAPRSDASRMPAVNLDAVRAAMDASRQSRPAIAGTDRGNALPPVPLNQPPANATGAAVHPTLPPVRPSAPPPAPDLGPAPLPAVRLRTDPGTPGRPASFGMEETPTAPSVAPLPAVPVGPQMKAYEDLAAKGAPNPKWWQRALEIAGSLSPFGRLIEEQIPSTPLGYNAKLNQAALRAAKEQSLEKGQAEEERAREEFPTQQRLRAAQTPEAEARAAQLEQPDNPTDKKIDEYTNDKGQRVLTFQRADNSTYDKVGGQTQPKPGGHTSAFEAFTYGSPEEKKAAQDYIDLEKKSAARYRTPSEFDERYRLFKEDPDTYKSMFGDKDKASAPDRATATKMLNYFDRRRREINQDFTLDDAQKQEQLKDIDSLEKPFMDAVQPGAAGGGKNDRVEVIHPNGQRGTIPRSQLEKAKRKGYREAPTR